MANENKNLVYDVEDRPPIGKNIVFALQQFLAIIAATILVPAIVNGATGTTYLSQSAALIGAGAGTVGYLGDYNASLFGELQPMGVVMAKYKANPHMAVALSAGFGKLRGSSDKAETWYPEGERYEFSKSLIDVGLRFEYNFWAYGTGREYRGARKLAPFITLGLGSAIHGDPEKGLAVNLPIGAGVKYKLAERVNLTAEWRVHFTLSDLLDGKEDPYGIKDGYPLSGPRYRD